jgi:WD40 repeat protein
MGNCNSSQQNKKHIRVLEVDSSQQKLSSAWQTDPTSAKTLDSRSIHETEVMTDRDPDSPVSPAVTASTTPSFQSPDTSHLSLDSTHSQSLPSLETPRYSLDNHSSHSCSSPLSTSFPSSPKRLYTLSEDNNHQPLSRSQHSHKRHLSRALQARLDKARTLQQALSSNSREASPRPSPSHNLSSEEFESTLQKALIWAQYDRKSPILCTALSRRQPSVQWSTPPLLLAMGSEDGTVLITELFDESALPPTFQPPAGVPRGPTWELVREGRIRALDFSPDGHFLAVAGDDCLCALYQLHYQVVTEDEHLRELELVAEIPRVDRIYSVAFSPERIGHYLALGGYDDTVAICSYGQECEFIAEIPRAGLVYSLDWSPDGRYLAMGSSDKVCALVDVCHAWRRPCSVQAVMWHPNGKALAIASSNIAIVNCESWNIQRVIEPQVNGRTKVECVCWSPNGSYLAYTGMNNDCVLLESKTYATVHTITSRAPLTCLAWGEQTVLAGLPKRYLVIGSEDHSVVLYKAGLDLHGSGTSVADDLSSAPSQASSYFSNRGDWTWKENFLNMEENLIMPLKDYTPTPCSATVRGLAFSRGSKSRPSAFLAIATDDCLLTIRSTISWKVVAQLELTHPIRCLSFSNGSRFLAVGGEDSKISILTTAPRWAILTQIDFMAPITCLAFSKNNERLAVGTLDGTMALLDPCCVWKPAAVIDNNESPVLSLDWTSRYLACGRHDGTVTIFDSDHIFNNQFTAIAELSQTAPARSLAFGSSSRFLVVGGDDGILHVYSAKGDWVLCHQIRESSPIRTTRWSPTGRFLAFGGEQGIQLIDTIFWAPVEEVPAAMRSICTTDVMDAISGIAFSQDGNQIACCGENHGASVIDCTTWEVSFTLQQVDGNEDETDMEGSSLSSKEDDTGALGIC